MNYTEEKLEKSQVKFNYVVDKDAFNAAIKQAYEKTKHKYAVPGFRKGHAPQKVIEGMDKYRLWGELIVNYIYLVKKGDDKLVCVNYYDNSQVEIPLDLRLTPSKNSTAYYAKYNKLKRTKEFVSKKLEKDKDLLEYVKSIEDEIANLPYESDTSAIEQELEALGGGKKKSSKNKVHKEKAEPPYVYFVDGFYIYRGKPHKRSGR